jgi:GNAT superfamily N-acetyltransferase
MQQKFCLLFRMKFLTPKNKDRKKIVNLLALFFPNQKKRQRRMFLAAKKKEDHVVQLEKNKKFFGFLFFSTLCFLGIRFLYIRFFAVRKDKRDKGLGTEAIQKFENEARDRHDFLFLFSHPKRKAAHKFYFKNGFKRLFGVFFWKRLKKKNKEKS